METVKERNPWAWIPTLYFAEGIPYVMVMVIAEMMYKRLGLSNTDAALYTSWLYLPWVIKPIWSPLVDLFKTKRWWIVMMQFFAGAGLAGVAFTIKAPHAIQWSLAFFWLVAFSSATHDIAADGFYMIALNTYKQSLFVGIRSTFYRVANIVGQGITLMVAGNMETYYRNVPKAWNMTMGCVAFIFLGFAIYHFFILPRPKADHSTMEVKHQEFFKDFMSTFVSFFQKPGVWAAIAFMLLYRLPEALLAKINPLFLIDPVSKGGLGLTTSQVGLANGTLGIIGLTFGGIIGGIITTRGGLKKWLWPMVWSITLPVIVYVYMSFAQPDNFGLVCGCIFIEQFGYGFGFTAYMLYMLYFSQGESETSHYAICTAFMAASMMIPGLFAGMLQEAIGYSNFFIVVMVSCVATILVTRLVKIDPSFGIRKEAKASN
jgi:PAT family beta-lactamase induction signal transducer AmpG